VARRGGGWERGSCRNYISMKVCTQRGTRHTEDLRIPQGDGLDFMVMNAGCVLIAGCVLLLH
jgi:hypothetical protein